MTKRLPGSWCFPLYKSTLARADEIVGFRLVHHSVSSIVGDGDGSGRLGAVLRKEEDGGGCGALQAGPWADQGERRADRTGEPGDPRP